MAYKDGSWGPKARERGRKRSKYFLDYRNNFQEKKKARVLVNRLVSRGFLIPTTCVRVNGSCHGRIEGHHEDYSKPLDVDWLCSFHHRQRHNEMVLLIRGTSVCLDCKIEIFPPRKKYCSRVCTLRGWRKSNKVK